MWVFGLFLVEMIIILFKLMVVLDIGVEGWIFFNVILLKVEGEYWFILGYFEILVVFFEDVLFIFYIYVCTSSSLYLYFYYLNYQFESVGGESILEYDSIDEFWCCFMYGVLGDFNGVWGSSVDHVFVVGSKGCIFHKGGFGWGQ